MAVGQTHSGGGVCTHRLYYYYRFDHSVSHSLPASDCFHSPVFHPSLGTQWRASIFWRFYRDTATLALRASIFQQFYPDTATLGYSVGGFYFPAILSRHCHPWVLSGGLLFSGDFIETLPPLHWGLLFSSDFIQTLQCTYCICPLTQSPFHIVTMHCPCGGHSLFGRAAGESKHNPLYTCTYLGTLSYTDTQAYSICLIYIVTVTF